MKKLLVTAIVGGLATAGASLLPAQANDCPATDTDPSDNSISVQTDAGGVCAAGDPVTQTGHIWADGNDGNPDPADGYISASNDGSTTTGICADDNGGPAPEEDGTVSASPTCVNP